jgi:hypothetical protein
VEVRRLPVQRWAFGQAVQLVPVLPDLGFGAPIEAGALDLSQVGIGVLATELPQSELVYVRLPQTPGLGDLGLLARVTRYRQQKEGFEVGLAFVGGPKEAPPAADAPPSRPR